MKRFTKWILKKTGKKSDGFTFVETLVVLAIGAVLTAGSVISATRMIGMARVTAAKTQISHLSSALQCYFLDCGVFPTEEQGLNALWEKPDLFPVPENWNGPYLDKKPGSDPWGNKYVYVLPGHGNFPEGVPKNLPFVLISYGSDGREGGTGEELDIVSWL